MHSTHLSPDVTFPEATRTLKKKKERNVSEKVTNQPITLRSEKTPLTMITAGIFLLRQTAILITLVFILVAPEGTTQAGDKNKGDILGREGLLLLLLLRNAQLSVCCQLLAVSAGIQNREARQRLRPHKARVHSEQHSVYCI